MDGSARQLEACSTLTSKVLRYTECTGIFVAETYVGTRLRKH